MLGYSSAPWRMLVITLLISATEGSSLVPQASDHFPSAVPLGWSGKNSRLPLQQRGSAVPIIPDGHRRFQFYLYGPSGQLVPKWLSLQQIQNILLSMDPRGELDTLVTDALGEQGETTIPSANQTLSEDTVQQVINSVQQVISSEVAHTKYQQQTTPSITNSSEEAIKIPEVILQNLMILQQHTTPWYAPVTSRPITVSGSSATTSYSPPTTEPATQERITETQSTTLEYETTTGVNNISEVPEDSMNNNQNALKPIVDRWNSRFPMWSSAKPEEVSGNADKNAEGETTDDYHILPPSVSETVIPTGSDAFPSGSGTTASWTDQGVMILDLSTKVTTESSQNSADVTMQYNEYNTQMLPVGVSNDHALYPTTSKIVDEFYHTTLGNMYGGMDLKKDKQTKEKESTSSMKESESVLSSTQPMQEDETTTMSQLQSAVLNMATNLLDDYNQNDLTTNVPPINEILSDIQMDNLLQLRTSSPALESANLQVADSYKEIVPLQIRDPMLPETIYDIHPVPDPTTTFPPKTEKPETIYDISTSFLTVIDNEDMSTNSLENESLDMNTVQSQTLLDVLQNQGNFPNDDDADMKPHYKFPVMMDDMSTKVPEEILTEPMIQMETTSEMHMMTSEMPEKQSIEIHGKPSEEVQTNPSVNATFSPNPSVLNASPPNISVVDASSPSPSMADVSSPNPLVHTTSSLDPSTDTTSLPHSSVDTTYSPNPSVFNASSHNTSVVDESLSSPSVVDASLPNLSVHTTSSLNPLPDTTFLPHPSVDTTYSPNPSVDSTYSPNPSVDTTYSPNPSVDTTYSPNPSVDTTYSPNPSVDTTYSPNPSVDTSSPNYEKQQDNSDNTTQMYNSVNNASIFDNVNSAIKDYFEENSNFSNDSEATTQAYKPEISTNPFIPSEDTAQNYDTETPTIFVTPTAEMSSEDQTTQSYTEELLSTSAPLPQTSAGNQSMNYPLTTTQISASTETPGNQDEKILKEPEPARPISFPEYIYYYYEDNENYQNVLPPSQLAGNDNQSRIDLESLQSGGDHIDGDNFYDYFGQPVYLDDVPKEYYDYNVKPEGNQTLNFTGDLEFPGPNATSPYHEHHHDEHHGDHHGGHHGDHHGGHQGVHHGGHHGDHHGGHHKDPSSTGDAAVLLEAPEDNPGLEATVENLDPNIRRFVDVINDITFKVYKQAARQYRRKNFVMSPLSLVSTLNILLLGARGSTSAALSDLLLSDQFYTFNPHLLLKNITQSILQMSDIHDVAFHKQMLVEKAANPYPMDFFSRTVDYFYGAKVAELEPSTFDGEVREAVNDVVSNATRGAVLDFLSSEPLNLMPPLSVVSANFFHGRWSSAVTEGDLFDMNFIRFPTAERKLIRTVGLKKKITLNAGFSKEVGVTTAEIPFYSQLGELSLVLVMPGEQKNFIANGLAQVESTLSSEKWSQILRSMLPNTVMFKMPVFRHRSFHNFSGILSDLGLDTLFKDSEADFSGINTVKTLHLKDVVQLTEFQSCQVEEIGPLVDVSSQRKKRSPGQPFWGQSIAKSSDHLHPTGHYSPTFIYALPMTEYLRMAADNETDYDPIRRQGFYRKTSPQSSQLSGLSPFSPVPGERAAGAAGQLLSSSMSSEGYSEEPSLVQDKQAENSYTQVNMAASSSSSPSSSSSSSSGGTVEEVEETLSGSPYGEANMYLDPDDIRINRMGLPYGDYFDENVDRTRPSSNGAYYRQSNNGVLAFDRAFMYAVRHNPTGLLLFVGRYLDPEGN